MKPLEIPQKTGQSLEFTVHGIPYNTTIAKAYFVLKRKLSDADDDALLTKTVQLVAGADGRIVNAGERGTGKVRFEIDPADLDECALSTLYTYTIKIILSNDRAYTHQNLRGTVRVRPAGYDQVT